MIDILFWVKRVSHADRVSSKNKPANILAVFVVAAFFAVFGTRLAFASDITPQKVIDIANAGRKEKGMGELAENKKLSKAAMAKAEDMTAKDYFSHTSPEGTTPWHWMEKEDYDYDYAGENLAMDFVSAEEMNQAWLASPTHRANIMNGKYRDIGVAAKEGIVDGRKTTVVVQMFGSGDKKASAGKKENIISESEKSGEKKTFPELPLEKEKNSFSFPAPMITSPQKGEMISSRETEIFGRAIPGSKVDVFDRGNPVARSVADGEGWFRAKTSGFSEGKHVLKAESVRISAGAKRENIASGPEIPFFVDTAKPKLKYKLLAGKSEKEIVFRISTDKPSCVFEIGGERMFAGFGKSAYVSVKKDKLSVPLSVEDEAGNKAFREINLSVYHRRRENFGLAGELAAALAPEKFFAADSGREAVRSNLGIIPRPVQISLALD